MYLDMYLDSVSLYIDKCAFIRYADDENEQVAATQHSPRNLRG